MAPALTIIDPNISNGTCWYTHDELANPAYIPCGNDAYGPQSCCQAGDICLSSHACWNGPYGVTYLAGCTDNTYDHESCPNKGRYYNQQWVGLVRCFISKDADRHGEIWAGCKDTGQPTLTTADDCICRTTANVPTFTDGPALSFIAELPGALGGTITWQPGFKPTTTMTITPKNVEPNHSLQSPLPVTTTMSATKPSSTPTNDISAVPQDSPKSTNNLSTSGKIGIALSTGLGVIMVVLILTMISVHRRRRSRRQVGGFSVMDMIRPRSQIPAWRGMTSNVAVARGSAFDVALPVRASELPANEIPIKSTEVRNGGVKIASPPGNESKGANELSSVQTGMHDSRIVGRVPVSEQSDYISEIPA